MAFDIGLFHAADALLEIPSRKFQPAVQIVPPLRFTKARS
jgi:hypothetical protein